MSLIGGEDSGLGNVYEQYETTGYGTKSAKRGASRYAVSMVDQDGRQLASGHATRAEALKARKSMLQKGFKDIDLKDTPQGKLAMKKKLMVAVSPGVYRIEDRTLKKAAHFVDITDEVPATSFIDQFIGWLRTLGR